jgi:hypothetical protein
MKQEISPVTIVAIVVGLLVCVGGFFFLRGALAPKPNTSEAEKAGQRMMESNRRPRATPGAQGPSGMRMMPGQPGRPPLMPGQPGGTPTMPGQPGR